MRYLLNSPVLTSYGEWRFEGPISLETARDFVAADFVSAIGHEGSAKILSALLDREIPVNRVAVTMQPGDKALVLRLKTRLPEGVVLDADTLSSLDWELALLSRVR